MTLFPNALRGACPFGDSTGWIFLFFVSTGCFLLGAGPPAPVRAQAWELVWADEFDGTQVDPARWSFQIGTGCPDLCGWGNNELEYYRAENATVADGFLTITAQKEAYGGSAYTSARLRTLGKGDWTYGRFEMRAKLPIGRGLWPAFWMLPTENVYGGWAASGEIDIMEYLGHDPDRVTGAIHYGGPWPNNVFSTDGYDLPSGTFHDGFHVFALEWEEGELRWYVDDALFMTRASWSSTGGAFPAPFDQPFHILLNLAVGGNLPGPPDATTVFPQSYVIDYVRVYKASGTGVGVAPEEGPGGFALGAAYPNPFTGQTRFTLRLAAPQHVTVELIDVLGRSVARLYEGLPEGGAQQTFTIEGTDLPGGVYVYRVRGERFADGRRVVLLGE